VNQPARTLSVADVPQLLRRHRRKVVLFCLLAVGADLAWVVLARRTYESEAKLYLRVGRESLTLDPSATTGQTVQLQQTLENQINSTLQIFDNRYLAEQVVDQIGATNILAGDLRGDSDQRVSHASFNLLGSISTSVGLLDPESDRNRAIRKLQSQTFVSSPRNSSILNVQCRAESPALAQQITQAWVEVFLREHVRLTHTLGSREFFAKQVQDSRQQLAAAEQKLRDAKDAAALSSVDGQRRILDDFQNGLRLRLAANAASLESSKARVVELLLAVCALSPSPLAQKAVGVSDQAWTLLRERRRTLETREQELRSHPPGEPLLASLTEQRRRIDAILAAATDTRSQQSAGSNATYQNLHQGLLNEQATLAALTEEHRALEKQAEAARRELHLLNRQAAQIVDLDRQVAILEAQYRTSVEKAEQSRIQEALEQHQISSVNVVQPATFVERPISPNKPLLLVLGVVVSVFGSIGVALLADYGHHSKASRRLAPQAGR
jgi:polysaccharide biosynthesis protein PslE